MIRKRKGVSLLLALGLFIGPAAGYGKTFELPALRKTTATIGAQLTVLEEEYRKVEGKSPKQPLRDRLENAETLVMLGEFEPASLALLSLIGDAKKGGEKTYTHTLHQLAESMFQVGNYALASEYFQQLAERSVEQRTMAVRRLIQIGDITGSWEHVKGPMKILRADGALPSDIAYVQAKSDFRRGRYDDVIKALGNIRDDDPYYAKALYLTAVTTLQKRDLAGATEIFERISKLTQPFRYDAGIEIVAMATLNRGRLKLEQGDVQSALTYYRRVRGTGGAYSESLHEQAWLHVIAAANQTNEKKRDAELNKAMIFLDRFLKGKPDPAAEAEARLLRANIQLQQGQHEQAMENFGEIVDSYKPVYDEVKRLVANMGDPETFLHDLIAADIEHTGTVASVASKVATREEGVLQAVQLVVNLGQAELWMYETSRMLVEFLETIKSTKRVPPGLEKGYAELLGLHARIDNAMEGLVGLQRKLVEELVGKDKMPAELKDVLAERSQLEPQHKTLPQNREQYEKRLADMLTSIIALERMAFQPKLAVEDTNSQLRKIQLWLRYNEGNLKPEEVQKLTARADVLQNDVKEQQGLLFEIEALIRRERNALNIVRAESDQMVDLRRRYAENLAREHQILKVCADQGGGSPTLDEINVLHTKLTEHKRHIFDLKERFLGLSFRTAEDARDSIAQLQQDLSDFRTRIDELRAQASGMVAAVTLRSMGDVEKLFQNIILRGDVGIVDVAWQQKETTTREINERVNEQRHQLDMFDRTYSDVVSKD